MSATCIGRRAGWADSGGTVSAIASGVAAIANNSGRIGMQATLVETAKSCHGCAFG